jgi:L-fuculose-phosphate aldolase
MNFKQLIVDSGVKMYNSGLTVETWGNISARDPETNLIYLTPSGMAYDGIVPEDIVVMNLNGEIVEGERVPTIETSMHIGIYNARPEVNAVIHTHPIYSMVFACQGKDIPLVTDEAAQMLGDTCKTTKYALPASQELADEVIKALGKKANSCLINSHGAVCVGNNMEGAFRVTTVLEVTAQILYMVESTGCKPLGITQENVEAMQYFVAHKYGQVK